MTDFDPGTEPSAQYFRQPNRTISALSLGVLVVEAGVKSGSLITACIALEQNREVFAIPGSIHNAQSKGCHLLIKQDATLVEQAVDLVTELAGLRENLHAKNIASTPAFDFDEDQRVLLDIIGFYPVDLDTLSRASS